MIPKFKTYLEESVWGSIRKKSMGQEERLENNVNLMDAPTLANYINNHYKLKKNLVIEKGKTRYLIPVFMSPVGNGRDYYVYDVCFQIEDEKKFTFHVQLKRQQEKLYKQLKYKFHVVGETRLDAVRYVVSPKDPSAEVTNKFMLEVLDFMIDHIKSPNIKMIEKYDTDI